MFQTIVFAYDGSAECRDALEEGIVLASRFNARCHLLAVVPPLPPMALATGSLPEGWMEEQQSRLGAILEEGLARIRRDGLDASGSLKVWEEPNEAIGAFARETGADLVIIGHHHRSAFSRWWHGSVGHSLLDQLSCSLLVSMPHTTSNNTGAAEA